VAGVLLLAVPGAACLLLLITLKRHTVEDADPTHPTHPPATAVDTVVEPGTLPAHFYAFALSCALGTLGLMTFGVISYDRWGAPLLFSLPALVVLVPALTLADTLSLVLAGVVVWGAVTGVQDSTVKALVADLVPQGRLATAYGVFAAFQGVAALAGGTLAGGLYAEQRTLLITLVAVAQVVSAALLAVALRHRRQHATA